MGFITDAFYINGRLYMKTGTVKKIRFFTSLAEGHFNFLT